MTLEDMNTPEDALAWALRRIAHDSRGDYYDKALRILTDSLLPKRATTELSILSITDNMVSRFAGWRLPETFNPDGGVSFTPPRFGTVLSWPTGTNLLSANEAREMLAYVLFGEDDAAWPYRAGRSPALAAFREWQCEQDPDCGTAGSDWSDGAMPEDDEEAIAWLIKQLHEYNG